MKQIAVFTILIISAFTGFSQQLFFKSAQIFSKEEMGSFFASATIADSLLLFNAPNYQLYAYHKKDGSFLWTYNLRSKSNLPPFAAQNSIWANGNNEVVQLNAVTGTPLRTLKNISLDSPPLIMNNLLYGTGIYEGGNLYAYDLQADSVRWTKFISHGITTRPYYQADKIVANGEADNWIEVNYNGRFKDGTCETEEQIFPSELTCVKKFLALTHDGKEIKGKLAEKINPNGYNDQDILYGANTTFILSGGKLYVMGNKLKLRSETDLSSLSDTLAFNNSIEEKLLKADDEKIWLLTGDYLLVYHFQKKNLVKALDLKAWEPHQAIVDDNKLWLISRKDGLLYGLTMD